MFFDNIKNLKKSLSFQIDINIITNRNLKFLISKMLYDSKPRFAGVHQLVGWLVGWLVYFTLCFLFFDHTAPAQMLW